ncbi:MAG: porin family protein [Muribaculaceae bacterium]|nr:porin family protein [Muribaculaceae bacterium]
MKIKQILIAVALIATVAVPATAQFKFGPRLGVAINNLHFSSKQDAVKDLISTDNRAGFTGGLMAEFTAPVIGIGVDASLMYVRRSVKTIDSEDPNVDNKVLKRDYFEIPINLKYKFSLPVAGNAVSPFLTTGPSFAFATSKEAIKEAYKNKAVDVAWNIGLGVEFVKHLQIAASYGFGISKSLTKYAGINDIDVEGKTRCWTITAAYLF